MSFEKLRDEWIRDHGAEQLTQNLHYVFEAAENRIAALEAALAERDRMLRVAWQEDYNTPVGTLDEWLADLRERAGK